MIRLKIVLYQNKNFKSQITKVNYQTSKYNTTKLLPWEDCHSFLVFET